VSDDFKEQKVALRRVAHQHEGVSCCNSRWVGRLGAVSLLWCFHCLFLAGPGHPGPGVCEANCPWIDPAKALSADRQGYSTPALGRVCPGSQPRLLVSWLNLRAPGCEGGHPQKKKKKKKKKKKFAFAVFRGSFLFFFFFCVSLPFWLARRPFRA